MKKLLMVFAYGIMILLGVLILNEAHSQVTFNKPYIKPLTKEQKSRIVFQEYEGGCFSAFLDSQYIMRCI